MNKINWWLGRQQFKNTVINISQIHSEAKEGGMRKFFLMISVFLGLMAFVLPAQAATLSFDLGTSFTGLDKPDPDGIGPWLTADFDDGGTSGSVYLTLTANLTDSNKVGLWYFNLDPVLDPTLLSFAVQGQPTFPETTAPEATISKGSNNQKADGDGWYDIEFNFPKSNPFDNHESIPYLITSTEDIWASSFDFLSEPGGGEGIWKTAAHIQSITTDSPGSTWIGDGGVPVPVPPTILLFGCGLIGLAVVGRKKIQ